MIQVRKSEERGHARHGWLDIRHTFSFDHYYDPLHNGFRDLLVINEDRVQPGTGFGKHAHRDMEIISYVLGGELEHKDSMGSGSVIRSGDVQRMSAGTGVTHSEWNHSQENWVHFLQIWIAPRAKGIVPSYEERKIPIEERKNQLKLIASPNGEGNSLTIHQDVRLYASLLDEGSEVSYALGLGRYGWLQLARGSVELNSVHLQEGDGAAISGEDWVKIVSKSDAEFLFFDLP